MISLQGPLFESIAIPGKATQSNKGEILKSIKVAMVSRMPKMNLNLSPSGSGMGRMSLFKKTGRPAG